MPEKEISAEQLREINGWLCHKEAERVSVLAQHGVEVHIWDVDGEPFVVTKGTEWVHSFGYRERWKLNSSNLQPNYVFSSDRHARELEEAGIVNFSRESQQGATEVSGSSKGWDPTSPSHF